MKSENGQIIESDEGEYYNASELFFFNGNVNMYTDSVFVKTSSLKYDSAAEKAWFTSYIDFWKEDNMLSADGGWYESGPETFFFEGDVHAPLGGAGELERLPLLLPQLRRRADARLGPAAGHHPQRGGRLRLSFLRRFARA